MIPLAGDGFIPPGWAQAAGQAGRSITTQATRTLHMCCTGVAATNGVRGLTPHGSSPLVGMHTSTPQHRLITWAVSGQPSNAPSSRPAAPPSTHTHQHSTAALAPPGTASIGPQISPPLLHRRKSARPRRKALARQRAGGAPPGKGRGGGAPPDGAACSHYSLLLDAQGRRPASSSGPGGSSEWPFTKARCSGLSPRSTGDHSRTSPTRALTPSYWPPRGTPPRRHATPPRPP